MKLYSSSTYGVSLPFHEAVLFFKCWVSNDLISTHGISLPFYLDSWCRPPISWSCILLRPADPPRGSCLYSIDRYGPIFVWSCNTHLTLLLLLVSKPLLSKLRMQDPASLLPVTCIVINFTIVWAILFGNFSRQYSSTWPHYW
jgi:hypothetical protein